MFHLSFFFSNDAHGIYDNLKPLVSWTQCKTVIIFQLTEMCTEITTTRKRHHYFSGAVILQFHVRLEAELRSL